VDLLYCFGENGRLPHIILNGNVSIVEIGRKFPVIKEEKTEWLIKIDEVYVERSGGRALMPTVVVEEGHSQTYYIRISVNESSGFLTVRLDSSTDPIKTRGVKRSIAVVAETIVQLTDGIGIHRHNLEGYLTG